MNRYTEKLFNIYVRKKYSTVENNGVPSVLLICRHPLGDTVIESITIRELRNNFPEHKFIVIGTPSNRALLQQCPYIDELLIYDDRVDKHYLKTNFARCRKFADEHYRGNQIEWAIVPSTGMPSLVDAYLAFLSGARERVAFTERTNPVQHHEYLGEYDEFFTKIIEPKRCHEALEQQHMLLSCGLRVQSLNYEIWTTPDETKQALELYQGDHIDKKKICCVVNMTTSVPSKDWPVERYVEVCKYASLKFPIEFILVGAGERAAKAAKTFKELIPRAHNFCNQLELRVSSEIIHNAHLYLGGDTGPAHIAAAYHLPCIVIYKTAENTAWLGRFHERLYPWKTDYWAIHPNNAIKGCECECSYPYPHCILKVEVSDVEKVMLDACERIKDEGKKANGAS